MCFVCVCEREVKLTQKKRTNGEGANERNTQWTEKKTHHSKKRKGELTKERKKKNDFERQSHRVGPLPNKSCNLCGGAQYSHGFHTKMACSVAARKSALGEWAAVLLGPGPLALLSS